MVYIDVFSFLRPYCRPSKHRSRFYEDHQIPIPKITSCFYQSALYMFTTYAAMELKALLGWLSQVKRVPGQILLTKKTMKYEKNCCCVAEPPTTHHVKATAQNARVPITRQCHVQMNSVHHCVYTKVKDTSLWRKSIAQSAKSAHAQWTEVWNVLTIWARTVRRILMFKNSTWKTNYVLFCFFFCFNLLGAWDGGVLIDER